MLTFFAPIMMDESLKGNETYVLGIGLWEVAEKRQVFFETVRWEAKRG